MAQTLARLARRPIVVAFSLILLALLMRAGVLANPLNGFDEQFYLLVGDRMAHAHAVPYVDIFDRKPLGLFLIAAAACLPAGDPLIRFELLAALSAAVTALIVYHLIRRSAATRAAWGGAIIYLAWLVFLENDGAQAQVFMNLFTGVAALLTARALRYPAHAFGRTGTLAMLAAGIALQIKPTCVVEAAFFGLALLWTARKAGARPLRLIGLALFWVALGLAPIFAAFAWYAAHSYGHAFLFATFISPLHKLPDMPEVTRIGALEIAAILLFPAIIAGLAPRAASHEARAERRFVHLWLAAALLGLVAWGAVTSPQYAAGAMLPFSVAAGYGFEARRARWFAPAIALIALIVGQVLIFKLRELRGGPQQAALLARAAQPTRGCLFVYDGPPALYRLTHSCLLSAYVFPGHLNMADEADPRALGVDPAAETGRIMALHPETVVDTRPGYRWGNAQSHAILARHLERNYRLVFALHLRPHDTKLVYRLLPGR